MIEIIRNKKWYRNYISREYTDKDDSECFEYDINKWSNVVVDLSLKLDKESHKHHYNYIGDYLKTKSLEELNSYYNVFTEICDPKRMTDCFLISHFEDKNRIGIITKLVCYYQFMKSNRL